MPYTPAHVANFFIDQALQENRPLTQMKLLKLVYIGFGWVIALTDKALFNEDIQAWKHGPVVPSLYHEFKHFRGAPIEGNAGVFDLDSQEYSEPRIPVSDEDTVMILGKVWYVYKRYSAWNLRNKTHEEDTPWHTTYDEYVQGKVIPTDLIRGYFKVKLKEYLDAVA